MLNITGDKVRRVLQQALSPTFLFILLASALLWYTSKLSHQYDTELPLGIRIDGQKYRLTAIVSGRGSAILAQRLSLKRKLSFTLDELSPRPSRTTLGALTIAPASLQKAINGKISDLVVVEVIDAPEFIPSAAPGTDGSEGADRIDGTGPAADDGPAVETPREKRKRERRERSEAKEAARAAAREAEAGDEAEEEAEEENTKGAQAK